MIPRYALLALVLASAAVTTAADAPSETDLAAITYFAPISPFYFRMMGPDGELREFEQTVNGFRGPRGWEAEADGRRVTVSAPKHRSYVFENGRLVRYVSGKKSYAITYPCEPVYGGAPATLWALEPGQMDTEAIQKRFNKITDIWSMTGRFSLWFRSPNAAGGFLACIAVLGAALFLSVSKVATVGGLVLMLASLAGLVLTSSRGGIVAFLVGFAVVLAVAFLRRRERPVGKRVLSLVVCLVLAAVFAIATQGTRRFTKSFARAIEGRGEGRDRSALFTAGAHMMADAPGGWGVANAGRAYSHWYQSMGGNTWQVTLVSDQLTHLVGYGWVGRFFWLFGWFAAIALLWKFALRGFGAAGVAVVTVLFTASSFNLMLGRWELWILPAGVGGWFVYRMIRGEWRERSGYLKWIGIAAIVAAVGWIALYAVCTNLKPTTPRVRCDEGRVIIGEGEPQVWIVDDGETLGGIYTQNLLRRHYLGGNPPAAAYCRSVGEVPKKGVRRLVLAGRQGRNYLDAFAAGVAPMPQQLAFVSPPFGPSKIPSSLQDYCAVGMLLGEFAARYVDVYGEGPYPSWVTIVKGAELYIPNWTGYVIGGK